MLPGVEIQTAHKDEALFQPQGRLLQRATFPSYISAPHPLMQKSFLRCQSKQMQLLHIQITVEVSSRIVVPQPRSCRCSEVEAWLAISCWCWDPVLRDCPRSDGAGSRQWWPLTSTCSCMGGKADSYHDNLWMESAWLAELWVTAEVLQTADELLLFNMF